MHTTEITLPTSIQTDNDISIAEFQQQLSKFGYELPNTTEFQQALIKVWACSEFVSSSCKRYPNLLIELINSKALFSEIQREQYVAILNNYQFQNEADLMQKLRYVRRQEMVRIAWRDLAGWSNLAETLLDLTALAEACVQTSLDFIYQIASKRFGIPALDNGEAMNIVVLGMGKLGAWELNYSSDIDLIFAYAEDGVLANRKQTTYGEFFTRICRTLVKVLDAITVDGFVFRTDIRLRPFGDSGPIIMTFDGMEHYYLTQAREWERYAMIKARQIAGDFVSGKDLSHILQPFIYRRYLDYGAFAELRSLKAQISQELQRKDRGDNIKLGWGGIREIEFIGQAFQLIRGGQEPKLQQRGILNILATLDELKLLESADAQSLIEAYKFLRRVENHLQEYQDQQTHDLPNEIKLQQILAYSLNFADWETLQLQLNTIRTQVHSVFEAVFSLSTAADNNLNWFTNISLTSITELDFSAPETILHNLEAFKNSNSIQRLSVKGNAVLNNLMPILLTKVAQLPNAEITLNRLLQLLESVAGRNVYLALLAENPLALQQLITLSSASIWICEYLAKYPILFDELLDTRSLYEPLNKTALQQQLQYSLKALNLNDTEQVMIAVRKFKHVQVLRVVAADIMHKISLTVVSNYLTAIAEVILDYVVDYSWNLLTAKHGLPINTADNKRNFAILGFGKLGGIELGYASDLDLVFLYTCDNGNAVTTGNKPIPNTQFYGRLGQKIRHFLDTKMLAGQLYEVDMRLRPSGNSGLLVTHLHTYEQYLRQNAWTWEHQALIRGRFVTGETNLQHEYDAIRQRILSLPREYTALKLEVREMREKMRASLTKEAAGEFNLKHGHGGIADIEFMVQFAVLASSFEYPALSKYTDNIHLIEQLAQYNFFTPKQAKTLTNAYCAYRDYGHKQVLQGHKTVTANTNFIAEREFVQQQWQQIML